MVKSDFDLQFEDLNIWSELALLEDNRIKKLYYKFRSLFWKPLKIGDE